MNKCRLQTLLVAIVAAVTLACIPAAGANVLPAQDAPLTDSATETAAIAVLAVNDEIIRLPSALHARIIDGVMYAPLELMAKEFGAQVEKTDTNAVFVRRSDVAPIIFYFDREVYYAADLVRPFAFFSAKGEYEGEYMVPIADMARYLGYKVSFYAQHRIVHFANFSGTADETSFWEQIQESYDEYAATFPKAAENAVRGSISDELTADKKVAYLTFDDGPSIYSNEIMDLLDQYDMKATFFIMGSKIDNKVAEVERMFSDGHGVGLHGMTHRKELFYRNALRPSDEMNLTNDILQEKTGYRTSLIRVPYGSHPLLSKQMYLNLKANGYAMWDWNIDSGDSLSNRVTSSQISSRVIADLQKSRSGNPIILLHEKNISLQALEKILSWMKAHDFTSFPILDTQLPYNWKE